jgi:hypothetical protein
MVTGSCNNGQREVCLQQNHEVITVGDLEALVTRVPTINCLSKLLPKWNPGSSEEGGSAAQEGLYEDGDESAMENFTFTPDQTTWEPLRRLQSIH